MRRRITDVTKATTVLTILIGIGVVGLFVFAYGRWCREEAALEVVGIGLAFGGASFLVGGLIGFLFGIPRTIARDLSDTGSSEETTTDSTAKATNTGRYGVNTNLEQISDWLTKILVGVGLTQIAGIGATLKNVATTMSVSMGIGNVGAVGFAASLMVHFLVTGFFAGYLLTRLFLAGAFARADEGVQRGLDPGQMDVVATLEGDSDPANILQKPPDEIDNVLTAIRAQRLEDLKTVREVQAWAKAQMIAGRPKLALVGFEKAYQMAPADSLVHVEYAGILSRTRNHSRAIGLLELALSMTDPRKQPSLYRRIYEGLVLNNLYVDPPHGFRRAIELSGQYLHAPCVEERARLWKYRAAAFGQSHMWESEHGASSEVMEPLAQRALEAVDKAVKLDPKVRRSLRALWDPNDPQRLEGDDDLTSLHDDPRFKEFFSESG